MRGFDPGRLPAPEPPFSASDRRPLRPAQVATLPPAPGPSHQLFPPQSRLLLSRLLTALWSARSPWQSHLLPADSAPSQCPARVGGGPGHCSCFLLSSPIVSPFSPSPSTPTPAPRHITP